MLKAGTAIEEIAPRRIFENPARRDPGVNAGNSVSKECNSCSKPAWGAE